VLLDPFAERVFFPPDFSRATAMQPGTNDGRAPLGVLPVLMQHTAGLAGPRHAWHEIVIYELHVKGFTARANSGVTPEKARHISRADRQDSVFAGARRDRWWSCCRCINLIRRREITGAT
jgi:hypothetical protein